MLNFGSDESFQRNSSLLPQSVSLVSFLVLYSEFIKIYDNTGNEVFRRRGCDSFSGAQSVEVPFGDGDSITLMVLLSYRYSYARIQYTVLEKALDSGNKSPSGAPQTNLKIDYKNNEQTKQRMDPSPETIEVRGMGRQSNY